MDAGVFAAVLCAAALHATWNAMMKVGHDRTAAVVALSLGQAACAVLAVPFAGLPVAAAWPWIAASAVLHMAYKVFLERAYVHGELSQVYPIARGAAPLAVALVSGPLIGEPLSATGFAAVLAIGAGVVLMSMKGGAGVARLRPAALGFALATAGATAAYTLVDGMGVRVAGSALAYVSWMIIGDVIGMVGYGLAVRGRALWPGVRAVLVQGLAAGAMSYASYAVALWAFQRAPIALVAALRETSVLFAMAIAAVVLRERPSAWRWVAAGLIVAGLVKMRI